MWGTIASSVASTVSAPSIATAAGSSTIVSSISTNGLSATSSMDSMDTPTTFTPTLGHGSIGSGLLPLPMVREESGVSRVSSATSASTSASISSSSGGSNGHGGGDDGNGRDSTKHGGTNDGNGGSKGAYDDEHGHYSQRTTTSSNNSTTASTVHSTGGTSILREATTTATNRQQVEAITSRSTNKSGMEEKSVRFHLSPFEKHLVRNTNGTTNNSKGIDTRVKMEKNEEEEEESQVVDVVDHGHGQSDGRARASSVGGEEEEGVGRNSHGDQSQCSPPRSSTPYDDCNDEQIAETKQNDGTHETKSGGRESDVGSVSSRVAFIGELVDVEEEEEDMEFTVFVAGLRREVAGDHTEVNFFESNCICLLGMNCIEGCLVSLFVLL